MHSFLFFRAMALSRHHVWQRMKPRKSTNPQNVSAQSYLNVVGSLTNVSVFAGAFTFGTLLTLPKDGGSFDPQQISLISQLLSNAFILFATALFLTVSLQMILRRQAPDSVLVGAKRVLVPLHFALISLSVAGGFSLLDSILIVIGQQGAGIAGLLLLIICQIWIAGFWAIEQYYGLAGVTSGDIELGYGGDRVPQTDDVSRNNENLAIKQ